MIGSVYFSQFFDDSDKKLAYLFDFLYNTLYINTK